MEPPETSPPPAQIVDRADLPRSFLNTVWPLAAVALMLLMLLRACVPAATSPPPPVFDAAAAARQANATALAALQALPPQPALPDLIASLNLSSIGFDSGNDVVPGDAAALLAKAAALITGLPAGTRIVITGPAGGVGDTAANRSLSLRRAEAVRAALISHGAPAEALTARGRGEGRSADGSGSDAGRLRNRRIEFSAAR
jgi:OOP family OmpA-OmpF porin